MQSKAYMVISMLIFSTIGLFIRAIPLSSSKIALYRGIIGSLSIFLIILISHQASDIKKVKGKFIFLIISGILMGINWILLFQSYRFTSIAVSTVCYYFAPVFVIILCRIFFKEKISLFTSACIITAIIGMFLISGAIGSASLSGSDLKGILYSLSASFLYACVTTLNKLFKNMNPMITTLIQLSAAAMVLLPIVGFTEGLFTVTLEAMPLICLIIVGTIHTGLCYVIYFKAVHNLSGQAIGILSYIDPISAILLSSLILHEAMTSYQIIGTVLILGAALFNELHCRKSLNKNVHSRT